ncbi:MAG: phosphotransferase family protein [Gordonia sp. (in: high G+C Gram-positive bacteria)]
MASTTDIAVNTDLIDSVTTRSNRAAQQWRPGASVRDVRPLTGGTSSLTFIADIHEPSAATTESVVIKVAPPDLEPVRNRDVLRQGRVMTALTDAPGVAAPAVYFTDAGAPPRIPPFVVMARVPGECVEPLLDAERPLGETTRAQTYRRFLDAARILGKLHRVRPVDVGLDSEPLVTLQDEIDRWTRAFETVPEDLQGDYLSAAAALHATAPTPAPPVINHGDYRLGNTLCVDDRVTAIIDWEIWSIGDPRIDLTWLTYFTDEAGHPAAARNQPCGTPSVAEVVAAYQESLGAPVTDIDWFHALTRYKEAAATGLLIKRARRKGGLSRSFAQMEPALPGLVAEAKSLVGY